MRGMTHIVCLVLLGACASSHSRDERDAATGASSDLADARRWCLDEKEALCRRELFDCQFLEPTDACNGEYNACVDPLEDFCADAYWAVTCEPVPTQAEAEACVERLLATDTQDIANDLVFTEVPECALLCGHKT